MNEKMEQYSSEELWMAMRKKRNHRTEKEKKDRRTHGRAYSKGREEW